MRSIFYLLCFFMTFPVLAQEEVSEDADSTVTTLLTEITISANRWEQNVAEVPGRISTISRSSIDLQNPQTAADMLTLSNQVFVQKSQLGGGSPMIRGFATNRVLLVVDGVRMNNAIFRAGNVQNVISLDANAVREAEVLFGPGAVMYGSDAIGGVMDFHTLTPEYSLNDGLAIHGNIATRYSSANNERMIHADATLGGKKVAFLASVTRSLYDDLKMGSNGPDEYLRLEYVVRDGDSDIVVANSDHKVQKFTGYDQWNAMQKVSFKPTDGFEATYAYHYSKTSDYPRYDRLILYEDGEPANGEWYYGPQAWQMHQLALKYQVPGMMAEQVKLVAAFQDFEESRHNRGFNAARRTDRFENVKAFSVNLDLDKRLNDRVTLFYGGEYVTNNIYSKANRFDVSTEAISSVSTRYPNDSDWRSGAVYASVRAQLDSKWTANASARLSRITTYAEFDTAMVDTPFKVIEQENTAINAALGLVFSPTDKLKAYVNLSTGFRAPNIDDTGKFFDLPNDGLVVPNPDLKPEYAYNAEIGAAAIVSKKVKFDVSLYYTFLDNAMARGYDTFNGEDSIDFDGNTFKVYSVQNISSIWVAGIQAGIQLALSENISLESSINYQKGEEKNPELDQNYSPTHVAPLFGSTHLLFTTGKFKADLNSVYNGKIAFDDLAFSERADAHLYAKDGDGNPYAPSWYTLNLKTAYQISKAFTVDLGIENILDKRYRPYSSGIAAPGRNWIVALRAKF